MSDIFVKADRLSKHFLVLRHRETAFRAIKAFLRREPFRKRYQVLHDISFEITKGERVAIIGRNGAGKTTLLRILAGIYKPTSGQVTVNSAPKVLFNFWAGFNFDLSVVDNIFLRGSFDGVDRDFLTKKIHAILTMAGLTSLAHSPVKRLSMGEAQRLSLCIFFNTPGDFLIFDECLAFVDKGFVQTADLYLKEHFTSDKTVIMASHDGAFLKRHCKRAIWLDEGRIRMDGDADQVISEYERSPSEAEASRTAQ